MGDAGPEEVEALERKRGEAGGICANPGFGKLAALLDVGDFSKLHVEAMLRVLLGQADEDAVAEAVGSGAVSGVELGAKVAAHRNEGVEGDPVAPDPGRDAGEEEKACESGLCDGGGLVRCADQ